jgi:hypothetical protein
MFCLPTVITRRSLLEIVYPSIEKPPSRRHSAVDFLRVVERHQIGVFAELRPAAGSVRCGKNRYAARRQWRP